MRHLRPAGATGVPARAAMEWAARVLGVLGADDSAARDAAVALVAADLAGHSSHGIRLIATYAHQASAGELVPSARPAVVRRSPRSVVVEGRRALGAAAMGLAVRSAVEGARRDGTATVAVTGHGHLGRLGLYVAQLSASGLVGVLTCGHALLPEEAVVAPLGGVDRVFDTNPWAFGFPAEGGNLVIDMSSAAITYNAVRELDLARALVPDRPAQDGEGRPCTDPGRVLRTGSLPPAGGAVGYGLTLAACGFAALAQGPPPDGPPGGNRRLLPAGRRRVPVPAAGAVPQAPRRGRGRRRTQHTANSGTARTDPRAPGRPGPDRHRGPRHDHGARHHPERTGGNMPHAATARVPDNPVPRPRPRPRKERLS
ncbi:hypothetical protein KCMC57_up62660 [Kitasatospora sp. CMC57]|uniref:Ldh family oxidoreductase n=1 Tax=Kitasatospora sp. CMC57 TaxID=3231513 RepID=A0AB33K8R9_9ACTN